MLIENADVEGSILAGLDAYASSHPHLKAIIGTGGSVFSKRFMLGLGWRGEVVRGVLEGEANPHEREAPSSSRNNSLVAGGAVSAVGALCGVNISAIHSPQLVFPLLCPFHSELITVDDLFLCFFLFFLCISHKYPTRSPVSWRTTPLRCSHRR